MHDYAPNCGLSWNTTDTKGTFLNVIHSPNDAPLYAKTIRINSFQYQGPSLFNILPRYIRDNQNDMEEWKMILDKHLEKIPDHPVTSHLDPGICDSSSRPSNSIIHWLPQLWKEGVNLNEP